MPAAPRTVSAFGEYGTCTVRPVKPPPPHPRATPRRDGSRRSTHSPSRALRPSGPPCATGGWAGSKAGSGVGAGAGAGAPAVRHGRMGGVEGGQRRRRGRGLGGRRGGVRAARRSGAGDERDGGDEGRGDREEATRRGHGDV